VTGALSTEQPEPSGPDGTRELVQKFLQGREVAPGENREVLFNDFVRWYQQKNPN
jgi:hypothetical protein